MRNIARASIFVMDIRQISRTLPRRALGHPLTEDALVAALKKENAGEAGGEAELSLGELSIALSLQQDMLSLAKSFIEADVKSGFFGKLKKRHRQEVDQMAARAEQRIAALDQKILVARELTTGMTDHPGDE